MRRQERRSYTILHLNVQVRVIVGGDVVGVKVIGHAGGMIGGLQRQGRGMVKYDGVWCQQGAV